MATSSSVSTQPRDDWHRARLLPTVGIKGQEEQEGRATSALLAVMRAVPEFGHAMLKELGAPKSRTIETYTEVRFADANGNTVIPDGAIHCQLGKRSWTCLVEVKTGKAALRDEQVNAYLDVARENDFDAVLTISNQITTDSAETPVIVDKRKLRKVALWHFSWWRVITEAIVQSRHRGVSDPDQAWILDELIAYLDHDASGAGGFGDMGDKWVSVRKAAHDGTLRVSEESRAVAERWEQFTQYVCMGLSQDLGEKVISPRPRKQSSEQRLEQVVADLVESGAMEAPIRIPNAIGDIVLRADLRTRQSATSVTFDGPKEMRAKPRINWILRQLRDAPDDLRVEVHFTNARQTTAELLGNLRDAPEKLLYASDPKREPRAFTLTLLRPMGQKRGKDPGSFVRDTRTHAFGFYRDLVQDLKAWQPRAPRSTGTGIDEDEDANEAKAIVASTG